MEELLVRAKELGYKALALTDHDNLCGAMHFAQVASTVGMQAITGAEVTLKDGSHLTLLAETQQGYSNLCNLLSYSHIASDRRNPRLDPRYLPELAQGLILLTGSPMWSCRGSSSSTAPRRSSSCDSRGIVGESIPDTGRGPPVVCRMTCHRSGR